MSSPVRASDRQLVERYFKAMQAGPDGLAEMIALFAENGEYVEPFSGGGKPVAHRGKAAIQAFFEESFNGPLHDVQLTLDRLDIDAGQLRSEWTCRMPVFPGPMQGFDRYTIEGGKIKRLEVTVSAMPRPDSAEDR
jgi:hypothetical protein